MVRNVLFPAAFAFVALAPLCVVGTLLCEDKHKFCRDWAERGECKANAGYMLVMCPLACGACSVSPTPSPGPTAKPPVASECSSFEGLAKDTDLGGDLLAKVKGRSAASCCGACEEAAGCEGFAYLPPYCYLKQNVTGAYEREGCSTRLRAKPSNCSNFDALLEGVDLAGELLGTVFASSADHCCGGCQALPGCRGFSYFEQHCYFKAALEGTFPKEGCQVRLLAGLAPAAAPPAASASEPSAAVAAVEPMVAQPAPAPQSKATNGGGGVRRLADTGAETRWV